MRRTWLFLIPLLISAGAVANDEITGKTVEAVEIRDSDNNPVSLPKFGETNLLLFYVDPDTPNQNKDFIDYLEENPINSDNIYSYGIINLKDAPLLPNNIVRSMASKRAEKTDSQIYFDPDHSLRDGWGLGKVNNKFVIIFVTKDKKIEFFRYGDFNQKDKDDFWEVINKYK